MNLKEKLTQKQAELVALKEKIAAGDSDAIKASEALVSEINDIEEQIKAADAAMSKLEALGSKSNDNAEGDSSETQAKSLGDLLVKSIGSQKLAGTRFNVSTAEFKADPDPATMKVPASIANAITTIDKNIVTAARVALVIRDLFGAETISGNALEYYVEGSMIGDFDVIAEGNKKAQVEFAAPAKKVVTLSKIAAFLKESNEYIDDAPFLASAVNGRLLYQLGLKEQKWLVSQLLGTSGIQTGTFANAAAATVIAEAILQAMADVQTQSGFAADAIVINPALYYRLQVGKNTSGVYYGGGYFGSQDTPNIWGVPVVVTPSVDGIIVGAFKTCGSVVGKGGISVEATNSDVDDFEKNLMTIRAEERLALAVRRPAGFKSITELSA